MKRYGILAISLWLASTGLMGCGGSTATPAAKPSPATITHANISINGQARSYRLLRPRALDKKQSVPLVVLLHNCPDGTADRFASLTHFDNEAITRRFVAVYPDGIGGCWNLLGDPSQADDLTFLNRLVETLATSLPIDQARIFVAGWQGGGHMAYNLACEPSSRITAIASISGAMPLATCHPGRPVSVMEMHGTADDLLPYNGGGSLDAPSVADLIHFWRTMDGCVGDPIQNQSGITQTSVWKQCKSGVVRLDTVVGGHNTWFGSHFAPVAGEPNASAVVSNFFTSLPAA